jgi:hypothetical protein
MQDSVLDARPEELTCDGTLIRKFKALRAKVIGTQQQRTFFLTIFLSGGSTLVFNSGV